MITFHVVDIWQKNIFSFPYKECGMEESGNVPITWLTRVSPQEHKSTRQPKSQHIHKDFFHQSTP